MRPSRIAGSRAANIALLAPVPIVTAIVAYAEWRALSGWGSDAAAFLTSVGLFLMSYLGIAISRWPMIVPASLLPMASGVVAQHAGLPAHRHARTAPGHSDVHGVVLLGVPRKGSRRHRIPLRPRKTWGLGSLREGGARIVPRHHSPGQSCCSKPTSALCASGALHAATSASVGWGPFGDAPTRRRKLRVVAAVRSSHTVCSILHLPIRGKLRRSADSASCEVATSRNKRLLG